ncbi:unnamed protein product [Xylocopa violacea]
MQYRTACNQGNADSTFNISQIQHSSSSLFFNCTACPNEKINSSKVDKTNVLLKHNGTFLEQATLSNKSMTKCPNANDKTDSTFSLNKFTKHPMKFSTELLTKSSPFTVLDSGMKGVNESMRASKVVETDLPLKLEKTAGTKENSVKTGLKSSVTNLESKPLNILADSKFRIVENCLKPMNCTPRREFFYTNSFTPANTDGKLVENSEFEYTVCSNRAEDFYNMNYEKSKASITFEKSALESKKLTNLSVQKNTDFCTNASCKETNCSVLNTEQQCERTCTVSNTKSTNYTSLKVKKDFPRKECESKCIGTIDSVLHMLQSMVKEAKKCNDKDTTKLNEKDYQLKEVRCKNADCNTSGKNETSMELKGNPVNPLELMRPECTKILQEIKKHTEMLEEQLVIINKSLRGRRKYATLESWNIKQQKNIKTQNPEKKNVYVQEPCLCDHIKYTQCSQLKLENNYHLQHIEKNDVTLQRVDKFNTCGKDRVDKCLWKNGVKSLKCYNNAQIQCVRSMSSHVFNSWSTTMSPFRPVATSTPKKENPPKTKESSYHISICTQTVSTPIKESFELMEGEKITSTPEKVNPTKKKGGPCHISIYTPITSIPEECLGRTQVEKIITNETKCCSIEKNDEAVDTVCVNEKELYSTCEKNAVVMLLLANAVNSKCSKSKYKKSEFLNFRPRCVTNSCTKFDQRLIKCRLSKRKMQIPVVFKLSSVRCKTEDIPSNRSNNKHSTKRSTNNCTISDLKTDAYTQSSNLKITTATSVPCIAFTNRSRIENIDEERIMSKEGCILS